ncbi:MFS transporter [Paenibacillus sp.]|jgi:CP family cyanate transporter-like MFS transporter|uniref:MFS transporter n=1 Tax=Paenibacillus sp. TaxID=58172 RepID=UPI00282F2AD0|nr:MFS transporter [Paenibacillus sp.]MDR0270517.1 MFS transporter [Paenibacillus sp.]
MRFIFLIIALFLASLNLRPVITSVSPMLGTIQESLGMSGTLVSLLTSLPVLCMGFFAPVAVKLSNRWSIERTIAYCLLLIGVATAARYYVNSAWLMLLTAFLAGVGIAIIGPLLSGFIKKNFANPSAIVGVYSMALVIGAALGSGFSVPLRNVLHDSWQASVASWSILAVIALFFWWRPAPKISKPDTTTAVRSMDASKIQSPKLPLNNKRAWLLTSFFGMMAFMFYSLTAWLPPIIEEQGYDKHTAGMILTLFTLIQIPVSFLLPILVSRFQRRVVVLIGCSVMELSGLLLLSLHFSPWLTCIFLGIGAGGLFPMALMLPIDESSNMEEANILSAMTQSGGYIFASLGPLYISFVHDYAGSFPPAIFSLMVVVMVMIGIQLKIGNRKVIPAHSGKNIPA